MPLLPYDITLYIHATHYCKYAILFLHTNRKINKYRNAAFEIEEHITDTVALYNGVALIFHWGIYGIAIAHSGHIGDHLAEYG
jgi:hypothetical protein